MKSQLKRGQTVNVYKDPFTKTQLEGEAVLQILVCRQYDQEPPSEVWGVRFLEDDLSVQRTIAVQLKSHDAVMSMLSSMARSATGKRLLEFMKKAELPPDWEDPPGHGVTAHTTGLILDNMVGPTELNGGRVNEEILVHLAHTDQKIVVNLNVVLALATAYVRQQYEVASKAAKDRFTAEHRD